MPAESCNSETTSSDNMTEQQSCEWQASLKQALEWIQKLTSFQKQNNVYARLKCLQSASF